MIGVDTTFLLELAISDLEAHARARELFTKIAPSFTRPLVLTPLVINELIHAATDPKRFRNPISVSAATEFARAWWNAKHVVRLHETHASVTLFLRWMDDFQLGRKRLLDTQLAATYHIAGVRTLLTSNPDDFKVFGVFELLVP